MKIDAVKMMREARDRISRETWGMSNAEIREYYRKSSRRFEALMEKEAPGREARLKAMGIFSTGDSSATDEDSGAEEISAVIGGSVVSGGTGYEAGEAAPAGAAISAKSGSDPD